MGEAPGGALVQAEPALQVNSTAGGPARQLLSVLAQSELRFGHLHSDYFFFHLSNGRFLCNNFLLLSLVVLACISHLCI